MTEPRKLTDTQQRVLDMVLRASRAGGSLTLQQVRERLGNQRSGNASNIVGALERNGLIAVDRGTDLHGSLILKAPRPAA